MKVKMPTAYTLGMHQLDSYPGVVNLCTPSTFSVLAPEALSKQTQPDLQNQQVSSSCSSYMAAG
jgi:hypothetical protein